MNCPTCNSTSAIYNEEFDFWSCQQCANVWSDGANDPDFDEDHPQAQEIIADRNIEAIHQLFSD